MIVFILIIRGRTKRALALSSAASDVYKIFVVGVSFSRAYLVFIVVEIVFALVPFGYLLRQQADYHAQLAVGTPRAVELSKSWAVTPNIVASFAVLVAVSLVVAFWFAYRRYVRAWRAQ